MARLWLLLAALVFAGAAFAETSAPAAAQIFLGSSVAPLNGPWRFHTGDDPRWADAAFASQFGGQPCRDLCVYLTIAMTFFLNGGAPWKYN